MPQSHCLLEALARGYHDRDRRPGACLLRRGMPPAGRSVLLSASEELELKNTKLEEDIEKKDEQISKLENSITEFKEKEDKMIEDKVASLVKNGIKEGKFKKDQESKIIDQFKNNPDGLQLVLDSISNKPLKITDVIEDKASDIIPEDKKTWNLRRFEKEDPKTLEKIKNEAPDLYRKMYKDQYNTELPE